MKLSSLLVLVGLCIAQHIVCGEAFGENDYATLSNVMSPRNSNGRIALKRALLPIRSHNFGNATSTPMPIPSKKTDSPAGQASHTQSAPTPSVYLPIAAIIAHSAPQPTTRATCANTITANPLENKPQANKYCMPVAKLAE